jgi:hypothetical protein
MIVSQFSLTLPPVRPAAPSASATGARTIRLGHPGRPGCRVRAGYGL